MVVEDINENGEALLNTGLEVFPLIQRVKSEIERSIGGCKYMSTGPAGSLAVPTGRSEGAAARLY